MHHRALITSVLLVAAAAAPLRAQSSVMGDGYLFGRPHATFTLRAGLARPNATGSVFDHASKYLTLKPADYVGFSYGGDLGIPISQRVELQFSVTTAGRRVNSEDRAYVEEVNGKDVPIEQSTRFVRTGLSGGLRYNLRPAGRTLSRLAWVPSAMTPYVAAGGGAMWYRYRQSGDFVDYQSARLDIFRSKFTTDGWTSLVYGAAGTTWNLSPVVAVNTEVRYDHARAPVRGDFDGFRNMALSGVGLSAGLMFRY